MHFPALPGWTTTISGKQPTVKCCGSCILPALKLRFGARSWRFPRTSRSFYLQVYNACRHPLVAYTRARDILATATSYHASLRHEIRKWIVGCLSISSVSRPTPHHPFHFSAHVLVSGSMKNQTKRTAVLGLLFTLMVVLEVVEGSQKQAGSR